jgi:hypothetical protein
MDGMEMDEYAMIISYTSSLFFILPLMFGGGFLLGIFYFYAVKVTANLIVSGGNPFLALFMILGRIALVCIVFILALKIAGGFSLLAVLAGLMVARALSVPSKSEVSV